MEETTTKTCENSVLSDKSSSYDSTENSNKSTKTTKKRVSYIYCDDYLKTCDLLPKVPKRASLVHSLIESYGLLQHTRLIAARPARQEELEQFHSADYIAMVRRLSAEEDEEKYDEEAEQYGLTYDCPAWCGVYEYAAYVVGGSLKAAQSILLGLADVAINWPGGWHHAKRDEASGFCYFNDIVVAILMLRKKDEASGFCYFNDIVVAILMLRKKYERVLYIDMDLHHGDGVEDAFCATAKVFTLSFHKVSPGFFPGGGEMSEVGMSRGKYHTLNVPLKDGIQDQQYVNIFKTVCDSVREAYQPNALVCQCGADGLYGDPMASYNLTPKALSDCVKHVHGWDLPMILLGGGGYNLPNTARCWADITATVLGVDLPTDIPEHKYFTKYGPDYQLGFEPGNRPNRNTPEYVDKLLATVEDHLSKIRLPKS